MPSLLTVGLLIELVFVVNAFFLVPNVNRLQPDSIVYANTPVGAILGRKSTLSIDGNVKQLTTYKGIPYAEVPVGKLRFEKPVPKTLFTSAFDATDFGPLCLQAHESGTDIMYSEDCLSLNVYVPSAGSSSGTHKPVMIWIHGGGFEIGSGSMYDVTRVSANGDVIVVTINYRLAQMGFLRINNTYFPGNYGLWDQHLAIKWVHDNIGAFGGDVNKVTIFGESAGSSSVMFQATYPGNKGLFQRVIAESGSTSSSWAQMDESRGGEYAQGFADSLGCNYTNDAAMMQCLKTVSADELIKCINASAYSSFETKFTGSVDGEFVVTEQSEMFILSSTTAASLEFYNSLDLIIGLNKADGMALAQMWAALIGKTFDQSLTVSKQQFEDVIVPFQLYLSNKDRNVSDVIRSAVAFAYTDWNNPNNMNSRLRNLIQFATDLEFLVPSLIALGARNMRSSHTFMYEFAFKPSNGLLPGITSVSDDTMANHGDELQFVFDAMDANATSEELRMAATMSTMWTNFAKTG